MKLYKSKKLLNIDNNPKTIKKLKDILIDVKLKAISPHLELTG